MNKIKDITLLVFAIIGFYTVISSFTTEPKNDDSTVIFEGPTARGPLKAIQLDSKFEIITFMTVDGKEDNIEVRWVDWALIWIHRTRILSFRGIHFTLICYMAFVWIRWNGLLDIGHPHFTSNPVTIKF